MISRNSFKFLRSNKICFKYFRPYFTKYDPNLNFRKALTTTFNLKREKNYDSQFMSVLSNSFHKLQSGPSSQLQDVLLSNLSTDIFNKNRVYKNNMKKIINKIKETNFSTKKQGLLLLKCCGDLMPDETYATRMSLAEDVWDAIKPHTKFDVDHYNELLKVYISNNRTLNAGKFINQMAPVTPNITTYELIVRALAEAGDINQVTEVLANMKAKNLPAGENVFNSLIICQGKTGKLNNVEEVVLIMKSLKIELTLNTYTALARAMAFNKRTQKVLDKMNEAVESGLNFDQAHIMKIVMTLAAHNMYGTVPEVLKFLPQETLNSPSISPYMQSVATSLVFQNHPMVAFEIYKCLPLPSFGPSDDQSLHGRSLVRDCVKSSAPFGVIKLIISEMMSSGRNTQALLNAVECSLQQCRHNLCIDLMQWMHQLGMPVRPHYFWPLLIYNAKTVGEKGIFNVLSKMVAMDVKPDYDTIMSYTLPFVSFTSPQNLMKKFQEAGLSATTVLTGMMVVLIKSGQVRAASEICELYNGKVEADIIIKSLQEGYMKSLDMKNTVHILEDVTEKALDKSKDWVGRFLCGLPKKNHTNVTELANVVQAIKSTNLKICISAADLCVTQLPADCDPLVLNNLKQDLEKITDDRIVDDIESSNLPHPRNMSKNQLRGHLNELEAKGMNTRGVLRKLLQQYCREGNMRAAKEVLGKCIKEGVFLSPGMRAMIFEMHVKLGELEDAEIALEDLDRTAPGFALDEFKVIDFATLLVYKKRADKAIEVIEKQSKRHKVVGGNSISKNCWRLLDAAASTGNASHTKQLFQLLVNYRYCKPTNNVLGPLIRVHLKNDNLRAAIEEFVSLSEQYKQTPLKNELLVRVLRIIGDGGSEESFLVNEKINGEYSKMVQSILEVDKKVHGPGDVVLSMVIALADVGYKKTLRKMLLDPKTNIHPDTLLRYCDKFVDDKKVHALENLAECAPGLRFVHVEDIYEKILDCFQRDDNHKAALALWYRMQDMEVTPSKKFVQNFVSLLKTNKIELPSGLHYDDKVEANN